MTEKSNGAVFWITGLSGSGKTTISERLVTLIKKINQPTVLLDGDVLREITGNQFGYNREDRLKAAMFYSRLCHTLAEQGINVICATISLFHEIHEYNRKKIKNYIEVFVDVPIETIQQRDPKKIYAAGKKQGNSNIVGIDINAELPIKPDIRITNHQETTPDVAAKLILNFYLDNIIKNKEPIHGCV